MKGYIIKHEAREHSFDDNGAVIRGSVDVNIRIHTTGSVEFFSTVDAVRRLMDGSDEVEVVPVADAGQSVRGLIDTLFQEADRCEEDEMVEALGKKMSDTQARLRRNFARRLQRILAKPERHAFHDPRSPYPPTTESDALVDMAKDLDAEVNAKKRAGLNLPLSLDDRLVLTLSDAYDAAARGSIQGVAARLGDAIRIVGDEVAALTKEDDHE